MAQSTCDCRDVRKQWAVHEDGALAYQMQNEEITQHYGLNRFHRRMVREDIPVAKFVQTEEEIQQQQERWRELEVLRIQAEEDAKLAKKISRRAKRGGRSRRVNESQHHGDHEIRNYEKYEIANHGENQIRDHQVRKQPELEPGIYVVGNVGDNQIQTCSDPDVRNPTFHDVRNSTFHDVRNCIDPDVRNCIDHDLRNCRDQDVRNCTDHDVRNRTDQDVRKCTDSEVLDDEELARQLQEKEQRKYERHLERKKLKHERQMLEAALAKDLEDARLTVNPESSSDRVSVSMESLNLRGVGYTRITSAGRIEDNGDFSDFYNLPVEMDEMTHLEIQASQDEELARLIQEQEHKRTKAMVDTERLRRIELHDEQLARIIQEEEKLRLKKAKQKHQARKEARRLMSVESLPLGASANSLNQPSQECPCETVPGVSSGHQRYRSNSYTKACDSPPSPARSPARRHRASPGVGEEHQRQRVLSHESIAAGVGPDHKNQYYSKSQHDKQPSTSSSTSSPGPVLSSSRQGLSTLETARQIAAGNPVGILAIQNLQKNTGDRKRGMEQDRFMRSQELLDVDRVAGHWSARRGSDPYRQVTEVRSDAVVYAQPYNPQGVLLGSELRQLQVTDVRGYLTDESGSSSGSASRLSRLHQLQQYQQQQQHVACFSKEDVGPQLQAAPSGLAVFNIVAAVDPTYQRRHPETYLLPETHRQSQVPFSSSLPQADGDKLEWDPNLRGSLRKTKAQIHGYQDPTTGCVAHDSAVAGDPVMSSWQPVQGQRRRDPGSEGKSHQRNVSGGDKKGNCKQQ